MPRLFQTTAPQFTETRIAGASTGVSLSTTAAYTHFIPGTEWFSLTPRNFSTAVTVRFRLMPYLVILKNQDGLVTEPVDASFLLQDGDTTATLVMNSMDTLANGDALYVGCHVPFSGLHVDVTNTNSTANDLAVVYTTGGTSLPSLTITDNTDTGASFAQDGTITWTVPTDWGAESFNTAFKANFKGAIYTDKLFWLRLAWSAAMDSTVTVVQMRALNRSTAYSELVSGQAFENSVYNGYGGFSGIEALTDAGTANLVIGCSTYGKFMPVAASSLQ